MKYFLIIITFALSIFASNEYAIEVISVEQNTSITDEFMQKITETGLSYVEDEIEGEKRVYLGKFKTQEEAALALVDVREKVSIDAFVCEIEGAVVTEPKLKMQQAMLMAQARTLKKMKENESKPEEKELKTIEPIKVELTETKIVIKRKDTKTIVAMKDDTKTEEIYCKDTKQALRETEIASAIAFYEKSSYYTFTQDKN
ncbi:MAG: hypothetical protein COA44_08045 [Arcobacter sp.]|nr:MAG: hypothetical protein COA44_08045 [Arcobacter sp.]